MAIGANYHTKCSDLVRMTNMLVKWAHLCNMVHYARPNSKEVFVCVCVFVCLGEGEGDGGGKEKMGIIFRLFTT